MKDTQNSPDGTSATDSSPEGFTVEERAAIKERAAELRAAKRRGKDADKKAEDESAVLAAIAGMPDSDRAMAERLHAVITATTPDLAAKLWYGMPAYARDGKIVCFFQAAQKFKTRYATLGFNDEANLDEGAMWPTVFALTEITAAEEAKIGSLVKQAVS